jgi:hypothetical protein
MLVRSGVIDLLPVSRSTRRDFAESSDKFCGSIRIGERFQMNRGRELWRFRAEVHLQNILPPR